MKESKANNDYIKFLTMKRESGCDDWFTVYKVCKELKKPVTTTVYRQFNRMVAYGDLEMSYDQARHAMLYRRKK